MATPVELVDGHAAAKAILAALMLSFIRRLLHGFSSWYSDEEVTALAEQLVQHVEATQRQVAAVTDAFLSRYAALLSDHDFHPVGPIDVTQLRQDVEHREVYERIAAQFRFDVSRGVPPLDAAFRATERAVSMAETDIDLAIRAQAREFMVVHSIDGYRRVIHPELSASGTCGLCAVASTRVYHRAELMPIHDRCKCTVLPIINGIDIGDQLNREDLRALYRKAGGTEAAKLKRTRYAVHQHGELGPVLRDAEDDFRGPSEIPA